MLDPCVFSTAGFEWRPFLPSLLPKMRLRKGIRPWRFETRGPSSSALVLLLHLLVTTLLLFRAGRHGICR